MIVLISFLSLLCATFITAASDDIDIGVCYPHKDTVGMKDNLCIHIINKEQTRQEAEKTCKSANARLPTEQDAVSVYKRLYWYYPDDRDYTFFFAETKNVEAIGYNMTVNLELKLSFSKDVKNIVICIRERKPKLRCPPGFEFIEHIPGCFMYSNNETRTWYECLAFCRAHGGFPVVFDTLDEYSWLIKNHYPQFKVEVGIFYEWWTGHLVPNKYPFSATDELEFRQYMRNNNYTIDGSPSSLEMEIWMGTEPNAGGTPGYSEHCVNWYQNHFAFYDWGCGNKGEGCPCRALPDQTQALYD